MKNQGQYLFLKKVVGFLCLFFLILVLPVILFAIHTQQKIKQHASSLTTYPVNIQTNLAYGQNPSEVLDLCTPIGAPSGEPGIIMIHGGGWSAGDKGGYDNDCQNYASLGYVVATINYRLTSSTPPNQWPDQIGDVQLAVRWLRANAQKFGLDTHNICSLGDSAGAHLALLLDTMQTIYPADVANILVTYSPAVSCVVDQFGPADLAKLYTENTGSQSNYVRTSLSNLLDNQTPATNAKLYTLASPINYVSNQSGKALIIQGTQDLVVLPDQSTEMQQVFQNAGIPVQFISYTGGHEYKTLTPPPTEQTIKTQIQQWILATEPPLSGNISSVPSEPIISPSIAISHPPSPSPMVNVYPANIEYNNGGYGMYNPAALTDPNIGAIDVTMDWSKVEPQQGVFNWTPLDNELNAWGSVGKKLVIIIRYIGETSGDKGNGTGCPTTGLLPSWEAARVPTFCDSDKSQTIPDYFDKTFNADLKTYVTAIANHITASQYKNNIIFVRLGLGEGGEGFPLAGCTGTCNQTDYQTDITQLQSWGWTQQSWIAWQENMLDFEKSTFLFTTVVYGISNPFTPLTNSLNINPATGNYTTYDVAVYAAANNMGVGQQGMRGTYPSDSPMVQIVNYLSKHYPNTFIQFAAVEQLANTPPCLTNPTTNCEISIIQSDIQALELYGAKTMDWWAQDDTNPAFQPYFVQWQSYINKSYGSPTPSITPSITVTPSPTVSVSPSNSPTPSPSPSIVPSISVSPQPTPTIPAGDTKLAINICLHGLGNCGDNANSTGGNANPLHPVRLVVIIITDIQNKPIGTPLQGTVTYDTNAKNFQGIIDAGNLPTGDYLMTITSPGFLTKQVGQIIKVTKGTTASIPEISLITGDINNDNQISILDYSIIAECYGQKINTSSCPIQYQPSNTSPGADILDDDGQVDGGDYNEFLRELSVQVGQ